jgi:hypothetical protein
MKYIVSEFGKVSWYWLGQYQTLIEKSHIGVDSALRVLAAHVQVYPTDFGQQTII